MACPEAPGSRAAIVDVVESFVREIQPLERALFAAQWDASVSGDPRDAARRADIDRRLRDVLSRPEAHAFVRAARTRDLEGDGLLARQLEVLEHMLAAHQMPEATRAALVRLETELDTTFNTFRAEFGGRPASDNALREVLQLSPDVAERRAAWEASKQVGAEAAPRLLELVRVRNAAARDLGYADYFAMMLTLDELDERALFTLLDAIERDTRGPFERYRAMLDRRLHERFGVAPADVRPWHLADPFFQEAPAAGVDLDVAFRGRDLVPLARSTFGAIGVPVEGVLERADLFERPGKSQHAFCLNVDRSGDIRVLCNLQSNELWMGVLLHELGHAVYDAGLDPELPWLLRGPAHTLTTEASAMLFGRWSRNPVWLERRAGVAAGDARAWAPELARATRADLLVMTRWCLVMTHMERELYRDPEQDLAALWWDLVERYQRVPRPDGRATPDWASKVHFSLAPVYYHNYLLGEVLASQLERALLRRADGEDATTEPATRAAWERALDDPATGRLLVERLYRPGRRRPWGAAIEHAVGEPLAPEAFVAELATET